MAMAIMLLTQSQMYNFHHCPERLRLIKEDAIIKALANVTLMIIQGNHSCKLIFLQLTCRKSRRPEVKISSTKSGSLLARALKRILIKHKA